jgi:hypothetical protein
MALLVGRHFRSEPLGDTFDALGIEVDASQLLEQFAALRKADQCGHQSHHTRQGGRE